MEYERYIFVAMAVLLFTGGVLPSAQRRSTVSSLGDGAVDRFCGSIFVNTWL